MVNPRRLLAAALLSVSLLAPAVVMAQQPTPQPTAAQEGFVPIDQLQAKEQLPAPNLVGAAYAVAWLAVFGYVWTIWRRLGTVEREIAEVSRRLASGGDRR